LQRGRRELGSDCRLVRGRRLRIGNLWAPVDRQHRRLGSQRRPRGQRRPALRRHRRRSGHGLRPPL